MARIAVLPESIANRIAAGEVVERPASALKELVENAIDAGARSVDVSIQAGGRDAISVTDDGEGMGPDDILLALERHATSKIHSDADIEQVRTLGFRGEAVPSIASVSRFRLSSRDASSEAATVVEVHGGRIVSVTQEPAPRGTRVEVTSLFYNAPARRKFLRSADTEKQRAAEVLSRFAIAYPQIRFRFSADGRTIFDHAPVASPYERCAQVFGRQFAERLLAVDAKEGDLGLSGLCSGLGETRSHTRDQYLFVNHRPVRDKLLSHAVAAAYWEALPRGRHPVLVLLLSVPPELVDVNVHPTKAEVRFRRSAEVHAFLVGALQRTLRESGVEPGLGFGRGSSVPVHAGQRAPGVRRRDRRGPRFPLRHPRAGPGCRGRALPVRAAPARERRRRHVVPRKDPGRPARSGGGGAGGGRAARHGRGAMAFHPGRSCGGDGGRPGRRAVGPPSRGARAVPRVLHPRLGGRLASPRGPARCARADPVRADQKQSRAANGRGPRPEAPDAASPSSWARRRRSGSRSGSRRSGRSASSWRSSASGRSCCALSRRSSGTADPERLVREILSDLREGAPPAAPGERARRAAASAACHAAIKVRFPLTAEKMSWLLAELLSCETPTTCPHGRPAILRLSLEEIERGFHRR